MNQKAILQKGFCWIAASRPRTLIIGLSPIGIGSFIACRKSPLQMTAFIFLCFLIMAIQIGTNFANDYFDGIRGIDRPSRKGPERMVQSGKISPSQMKFAAWGVFLLAIEISFFSLSLFPVAGMMAGGGIIFLTLLSVLLGFAYSGGKSPLSYSLWSDPLAFLFFGPISTFVALFLQKGDFSADLLYTGVVIGIIPGCFSLALLTANNLRDQQEDLQVGKKTSVVRFGKLWGKIEYCTALLLPFLFPIFLYQEKKFDLPFLWAVYLVIPIAFLCIKSLCTENSYSDSLLKYTGSCSLLYTVCFCLQVSL